MAEGKLLQVTVAWSPAALQVHEVRLELPAGATLADALAALQTQEQLPFAPAACGLWGRVAAPHTLLQAGDRVELYRPLTVDPKEARRQRFAAQGSRAAGLFARRGP